MLKLFFKTKTIKKPNLRLTYSILYDAVVEAIEKFFGDHGVAYMLPAFNIVYLNSYTNIAILRISRRASKEFHKLWLFLNNIEKSNVLTKVLYSSGSIVKAKKFLTEYCYKKLLDSNKNAVDANAAAAASMDMAM